MPPRLLEVSRLHKEAELAVDRREDEAGLALLVHQLQSFLEQAHGFFGLARVALTEPHLDQGTACEVVVSFAQVVVMDVPEGQPGQPKLPPVCCQRCLKVEEPNSNRGVPGSIVMQPGRVNEAVESRVELPGDTVGVAELGPGAALEIHDPLYAEFAGVEGSRSSYRRLSEVDHATVILVTERPAPLEEGVETGERGDPPDGLFENLGAFLVQDRESPVDLAPVAQLPVVLQSDGEGAVDRGVIRGGLFRRQLGLRRLVRQKSPEQIGERSQAGLARLHQVEDDRAQPFRKQTAFRQRREIFAAQVFAHPVPP